MDCPSTKTRERAYVLSENAKNIGLLLGRPKFLKDSDYISYWLTNMVDYAAVYCMPDGYLAEIYTDSDGVLNTIYLGVRNIRHLLQHLKKNDYECAEKHLQIEQEPKSDDDHIKEFLKGLDDDSNDRD